jgi:hypothetical protein
MLWLSAWFWGMQSWSRTLDPRRFFFFLSAQVPTWLAAPPTTPCLRGAAHPNWSHPRTKNSPSKQCARAERHLQTHRQNQWIDIPCGGSRLLCTDNSRWREVIQHGAVICGGVWSSTYTSDEVKSRPCRRAKIHGGGWPPALTCALCCAFFRCSYFLIAWCVHLSSPRRKALIWSLSWFGENVSGTMFYFHTCEQVESIYPFQTRFTCLFLWSPCPLCSHSGHACKLCFYLL